MKHWAIALCFTLAAAPAAAADRGYTVTDFDRIDVSGPFTVIVETGKGPGARATGDARALDALKVENRGRTLKIGVGTNGWGGWPGEKPAAPTIRVTVPMLKEAALRGGGTLSITRMRAQLIRLGLSGNGALSVATVETDRLFANLLGSGTMTLAGKALIGQFSTEGSGTLAAAALAVDALTLTANSAGASEVKAGRTATIQSAGTGDVTIGGSPACTVAAIGAGEVTCGVKPVK